MSAREIEGLVARAVRSNGLDDLTGVLLAVGGVFMQILEGPPAAVSRVFARIEKDARHRDVIVVGRRSTDSRLFAGWSMRLIELDRESHDRMLPVVKLIDACAKGSVHAGNKLHELDDELWRALGERVSSPRPSAP